MYIAAGNATWDMLCWFALCQSSPQNRAVAFSIMTKLYKKQITGENEVKNASAFIHKSVMNAWWPSQVMPR